MTPKFGKSQIFHYVTERTLTTGVLVNAWPFSKLGAAEKKRQELITNEDYLKSKTFVSMESLDVSVTPYPNKIKKPNRG